MVEYNEIEGKEVIGGKQGRLLGKVYEIEIDTKNWKVTHFYMNVDKKAVGDLGLDKSLFGNIKVLFPTSIIDAISDYIIINETMDELKKIVKPL